MQRLSNRLHSEKSHAAPQVQHVERIVEVQVASEPEIQYVDREVIKEVHVEQEARQPDQIIVQEQVDLTPVTAAIEEIKMVMNHNTKHHNDYLDNLRVNSDMQSRALVALKMQRDVDRKRRLTLIKRMRKEQNAQKRYELKLKLAIGASLLLSIASLIVKL